MAVISYKRGLMSAVMVFFLTGCIVLPVQRSDGRKEGGFDIEKTYDYDRAAVINTLDTVLVKQGFTITSKDVAIGRISAKKTGILASDYGYNRFQKFCFLWGYGVYGTMLLDASAESGGPGKTRLGLNSTPKATGNLKEALEELEMKLLREGKPRLQGE